MPASDQGVPRHLSARWWQLGWRFWPPAAFVFILPFAHTTALRSIVFALTLICAILVSRRSARPRVPLKLVFGVWMATALITLIWSTDIRFSAAEIKSEIAYSIVLFIAFLVFTRDAQVFRLFIGAISLAVLALCIHAFWQFARRGTIEGDNLHGGVIYFVTYLTLIIPVLFGALIAQRDSRWQRNLLGGIIVLAVCAGTLGLNRSFIPVVAMTLGLFAVLYLGRFTVDRTLRKRVMIGTLVAIPLAAAAAGWVAHNRMGSQLALPELAERTFVQDPRIKIWRHSLSQIAERPWTGFGFGRMGQVEQFREAIGDQTAVHPHNIVLSYGVQMGVPGMIAVLLLFGAVIARLVSLYRDPDPHIGLIGATGLCVVFAILLKNVTDDVFVRHIAWLFWCLLGMAIGYAGRRRAERAAPMPMG